MHRLSLSRFIQALYAVAVLCLLAASCGPGPKGEPAVFQGGVFELEASSLQNGELRLFRHEVRGRNVVFMVARTSSGDVKTAFDACITCYPHRMGYRREPGGVVCVYCGTFFGLEELGSGKGNCVPIELKHRLERGNIIIERSAVEAGAKWF